ncbi:hypothetical protein IWQ56_001264 [Coemansia nantahalensis]|nr:hypothetical protein IWQ56_001264 [Coemansia nantahalensis]
MASTTEQQQQAQGSGKWAKLVAALRRALGRRTVPAAAGQDMGDEARMDLALAIAAQYVMVSQEYPAGEDECGDAQTLTSPACAAKAVEAKCTPQALLWFIRRPRTASAGSHTICGDALCATHADSPPHSANATLREQPPFWMPLVG